MAPKESEIQVSSQQLEAAGVSPTPSEKFSNGPRVEDGGIRSLHDGGQANPGHLEGEYVPPKQELAHPHTLGESLSESVEAVKEVSSNAAHSIVDAANSAAETIGLKKTPSEKIQDGAGQMAEGISDNIEELKKEIVTPMSKTPGRKVSNGVSQMAEGAKDGVEDARDKLKQGIQRNNSAEKLSSSISEGINHSVEVVKETASSAAEAVGLKNSPTEKVKNGVEQMADGVKDGARYAGDSLPSISRSSSQKIQHGLGQMAEGTKDEIEKAGEGLQEGASNIKSSASQRIQKSEEAVKSGLSSAAEAMKEGVESAAQAVGLRRSPSQKIEHGVKEMANGVEDGAKKAGQALKDSAGSLASSLPSGNNQSYYPPSPSPSEPTYNPDGSIPIDETPVDLADVFSGAFSSVKEAFTGPSEDDMRDACEGAVEG